MNRITTLLLIFLFSGFALADNGNSSSLPWLESGYNVSFPEGASSRTNYKVVKDKDGFMWISTPNGVERYDGLTFRHYNLGKSRLRSIDDGFMVNVEIDRTNVIWTYTERNIVTRYNPEKDEFETFTPLSERSEGSIRYINSDGKHLFVGYYNGLCMFDLESGAMIDKFCLNQDIRCVEWYDDTQLLVGTREGLWVVNLEKQTSVPVMDVYMDVNCLKYDAAHGLLWIGSRGMGLFYAHKDDLKAFKPVVDDDYSIVNVFEALNDTIMLVGTDGNGLLACAIEQDGSGNYVPTKPVLVASESVSAPCQLPNSVIDDILVDGDNLWLTLDLSGVALLQPRSELPALVNPLAVANSDRNALDVSIDSKGRSWIAFPRCIACYEKPTSEPKIYLKDVSGYLTILAASDGTVWCGGYNAGTYHLDPRTEKYEFFPSVVDQKVLDCVYAFAEDDNHDIWVGGLNFGLTRMHKCADGTYEKTTYPDINLVADIRTYSADTLLVGTFDGVWIVNSKSGDTEKVLYREAGWEHTSSVGSLVVTPDKQVWFGTMGAGLVHYDLQTHEATLFANEYNLPSLEIRGVEMLNDSVLCASTEKNGIFAFDTRNHRIIRTLQHSNGQLMGIFSRSSSGGSIGNYVSFGSDNGVISVSNTDIQTQHDSFRIFAMGDSLHGNYVHLPYSSRNIYLQFTTNDIYNQNEYRFEYLIPGLTPDWESLDEMRRMRYLSIPPGSYELIVRSFSASGMTGEMKLDIEVDQVWYMRWYCLLTYTLLLVGLAWFIIYHYRIKHMSETDALTGIRNRYSGQKLVSEQLLMRSGGAFVLLDCDKFKHVNDTYGHLAGDDLLVRVARAIENTFPYDICMRLGGDEFAFYLIGQRDNDELRVSMNTFLHEIKSIRISGISDYEPSVSIGVAFADGRSHITFEQMYTLADKRLYESKKQEGCWVTYD